MTSDRRSRHTMPYNPPDQRRDVMAVRIVIGSHGTLTQRPDARRLPPMSVLGPDRRRVRLQTAAGPSHRRADGTAEGVQCP